MHITNDKGVIKKHFIEKYKSSTRNKPRNSQFLLLSNTYLDNNINKNISSQLSNNERNNIGDIQNLRN